MREQLRATASHSEQLQATASHSKWAFQTWRWNALCLCNAAPAGWRCTCAMRKFNRDEIAMFQNVCWYLASKTRCHVLAICTTSCKWSMQLQRQCNGLRNGGRTARSALGCVRLSNISKARQHCTTMPLATSRMWPRNVLFVFVLAFFKYIRI